MRSFVVYAVFNHYQNEVVVIKEGWKLGDVKQLDTAEEAALAVD